MAKHLVDNGLVPAALMDDVLQRQVVFGGSLGTNLLELGNLDEQTLTETLAEFHHLPVATPKLLAQRDHRMPNLFPLRLAEKYKVVPLMVTGRTGFFLACSRINPLMVEEIGFMLSLTVKIHVVCEARLQGYLRDWLGAEIEPRFDVLLDRLGKYDVHPPADPEARAVSEALKKRSPTTVKVDQKKVEKVLGGIEAQDREEQRKREQARSGRISLEEATHACMHAENRDVIVDVTLRFARQFIPYVGLFIYNNEFIQGWDAVGSADARERIRKVNISAGVASVLGTVLQTRAYYLGPITESLGNNKMLQALSRKRPRNALVVPISLKERLVGLLYGDAGPRIIRGTKLVELLVFVSRISSAFEQLILKKKAEAKVSKPPPAPAEMAEAAAEKAAGTPAAPQPEILEEKPIVEAVELPPPPEPPPKEEPKVVVEEEIATPIAKIELEPAPVKEPPPPPPPEEAPRDDEPVVVDDSFLEAGQILPAVPAAELGIPAAESPPVEEELHPGEERVKFEDLTDTDDGTISVVDDGTEVVVVDEETAFVPEQETTPPVPVITPLELDEEPQGSDEVPLDPTPLDRPPTPAPSRPPAEQPPDPEQLASLAADLAGGEPEKTSLARVSLLAAGAAAVPAIVKHFPGKLVFDIGSAAGTIPPLIEHSELLRCLVDLGEDACMGVADRLEDPDSAVRHYAVLFLREVNCPQAVPRLGKRLYDRDARIRLSAIEALQAYRRTTSFDSMLVDLRAKLKSEQPNQQAIAAALLGNFKDRDALALLAPLVKSPDKMVARAAAESLSFITKQDFGTSERKWIKWWKTHKGERRIRWLINGLSSKNRDIRYSSVQELSQITGEHFGYHYDSAKEEREQAVQRWEQWWEEKGRRMHFDD
jgi:hypothetical protein